MTGFAAKLCYSHYLGDLQDGVFFNAYPFEAGVRDIKSDNCRISVFQHESKQAKKYGV